jgi:hypothetical protein
MQITWDILKAMTLCPHKAWNLAMENTESKEYSDISELKKVVKTNAKAQKLLTDTLAVINKNEPPAFYRNPHCPQCHLKDACMKKLRERDCISLLGADLMVF